MSDTAAPWRSLASGRSRTSRAPAEGFTPLPTTRTRPTKRALIHLVLGVVLYGAGANVSAGWVVVLAALVLGTLPWALVTSRRAARSLAVQRHLPPSSTAGAATPLTLEIRARTTAMAVVEDELTGAVGVAGELSDGAELHATAPLRRGQQVAGTVRVTLTDAFGLVTVVSEGEVPSRTQVLPALPRISGLDVSRAWALEAGTDATRTGDGVEVMGVREYRTGDALRSVHWRSSARRGELVVRELADQARPTVRVELASGVWTQDGLDRACEVASAVAEDATRAGLPVQLAADGELLSWTIEARRFLAVVPPHAGATARPLDPAPDGPADITVQLRPTEAGTAVSIDDGATVARLGVVPDGADVVDVEAWLALQLEGAR